MRELGQIAGKVDVATALDINQPSVSKIEMLTDMYLSILRNPIACSALARKTDG